MPRHQGCKCAECFGLREWLAEHDLDTRGLPAAQGHDRVPLELVQAADTRKMLAVPKCDGSMVCRCEACQRERNAQATRAARPQPRQPWDVAA